MGDRSCDTGGRSGRLNTGVSRGNGRLGILWLAPTNFCCPHAHADSSYNNWITEMLEFSAPCDRLSSLISQNVLLPTCVLDFFKNQNLQNTMITSQNRPL